MLTEQQQAAIEEDINSYTDALGISPHISQAFEYGYRICAEDILTNPKKYGLKPI